MKFYGMNLFLILISLFCSEMSYGVLFKFNHDANHWEIHLGYNVRENRRAEVLSDFQKLIEIYPAADGTFDISIPKESDLPACPPRGKVIAINNEMAFHPIIANLLKQKLASCEGPNCFNTVMVSAGINLPRFTGDSEFRDFLKSCVQRKEDEKIQAGDIGTIKHKWDDGDQDIHGFLILSPYYKDNNELDPVETIVFAKNSYAPVTPYHLTDLKEQMKTFISSGARKIEFYDCSQSPLLKDTGSDPETKKTILEIEQLINNYYQLMNESKLRSAARLVRFSLSPEQIKEENDKILDKIKSLGKHPISAFDSNKIYSFLVTLCQINKTLSKECAFNFEFEQILKSKEDPANERKIEWTGSSYDIARIQFKVLKP